MATQTFTETTPKVTKILGLSLIDGPVQPKLPSNFLDGFEKLSRAQAGHLRHFHNLAVQPDDEWLHMGGQDHGQEWVDGYRYQLATMAYATGAAHYHRLPALRSVYRTLMEKLIAKMLRKEVWGYWFLTSHGGIKTDPSRKELRRPWSDPIKEENIMYSGHLLLMVSLYSMLFNNDKYDGDSALIFNWDPVFWGMGDEKYRYDRMSLQKIILQEMEKENWLGVCCEPNCIFVACNQFPLIAMRYNDVRNGTNIIEDVLKRYTAAWEAKEGLIQQDGLFVNLILSKQGAKIPASDVGLTSWACAFMNAWNPKVVHDLFPKQALGYISRVSEKRVNLNTPSVAQAIRSLVEKDGLDPNSPATLEKAKEMAPHVKLPEPLLPYKEPIFGYIVQWISEVGDKATLDGILCHADEFLTPTWERGGLYYPRKTKVCDEDGNWTMCDPFTGNGGIGYARLNVPGGQRKMWEKPWSPTDVAEAPFVDGVDLGSDVDFLRGIWMPERGALIITMCTWNGAKTRIKPICRNLPSGTYGIYANGELSETKRVSTKSDGIVLDLEVDDRELDIVLLRVQHEVTGFSR